MTPRQRRGWYLGLAVTFMSGAVILVLTTLNDHLLFFMAPGDILLKKPATPVRLGGIVERGSLRHLEENLTIEFFITDGRASIPVRYQGLAPDLFREGQGVVADGILLSDGIFKAKRLLARHDENYMPREVADALEMAGKNAACKEKNP